MSKISKSPSRGQKDARHLMRYLMNKGGMSMEEIARKERISLARVKESIRSIEAYEGKNSDGQLQLAVRDLIISTMPAAKITLHGLLNATTTVERTNHKTGKLENVAEPDKTTRLEALRVTEKLITSIQPKGPAVAVNVSQTNQTANIGSAETNEERMRRLRKQAASHNLLPAETRGVPEYIDSGEEMPDAGEEADELEEDEEEE